MNFPKSLTQVARGPWRGTISGTPWPEVVTLSAPPPQWRLWLIIVTWARSWPETMASAGAAGIRAGGR
jgi:hypothetical protein